MRDVKLLRILNFLLKTDGTHGIGLIRFKDQRFLAFIDWFWSSPGLPEYRIFPLPCVLIDELIHPLAGNLNYGLFLCPLQKDPLYVPIR